MADLRPPVRDRGSQDLESDLGNRDLDGDGARRDLLEDLGIRDRVTDLGAQDSLKLGSGFVAQLEEVPLTLPSDRSAAFSLGRKRP